MNQVLPLIFKDESFEEKNRKYNVTEVEIRKLHVENHQLKRRVESKNEAIKRRIGSRDKTDKDDRTFVKDLVDDSS